MRRIGSAFSFVRRPEFVCTWIRLLLLPFGLIDPQAKSTTRFPST